MQAEDFWILLTLLVTLIQCTVQDTLSCGSTTFQVTFEPSRPVVGSGGSAKFLYQPLDQLLGSSTVNMCNLSIAQIANEPRIAPTTLSTERRLVITRCENCSLCPGEIPSVHRVLTRVANELSLQSLLVIVHRNLDALKVDNTLVKFVFMEDDDPGSLTLCEIGDPGDGDALRSFSKTSVLFVSISFIILMVISLAWLVFYYVQRFRYAHAKDRLQRRLFNAAKKALTRIPTKPVKSGDKELDSDCPVCIDPYRAGDIVRCLPCRHVFHKTCVDPWLLEHRTCPMCKSDILKAFGYHVNVSGRRRTQFSAQVEGRNGGRGIEHDRISMDGHSSASESNAYPFPVVSEIHDPFSFTTAPAPQVVQVMHTTNVRGFSIIPLTVHNSGSMPSGPGASYTKVNASVERHTVVPTVHEPSDFVQSPSTSRSDRLLRTPTHRSSRKRRGHVVNLVHVRSRSLSQTQFPPTVLSNFASDRPTALFRSQSKDQPDGVPTGKPINPPVEIVDAGADDILGIVVDEIRPHSSKEGSLRDTRFTSVKPPARTRSALSNAKRHAGGIVRGQSAKVSRVSSEQHEDPHDDEDFFVQTPPSVFQAVQQSGSDPRNAVVAPELPHKPVPFSDTISVESL